MVPGADNLLRVAVLVGFQRGRLQSALALLRGANADGDQTLTEEARNAQLDVLSDAIDKALDLTNWHEYLKALIAAGFRRSTEISSQNSVLLVYALYLIGRHRYGLSHSQLRTTIARYFFMASLTGRYTGSFEGQVTQDVQAFTTATDGDEYLDELRKTIDATLTADFWNITLPRDLATSTARAPGLFAYAAAMCLLDARVPPFVPAEGIDGSEKKAAIRIKDLFDPVIQPKKNPVDRHHLFPRHYLETIGMTGTRVINQIANLSYVEWPENIEISATPPSEYWPKYEAQFTAEDMFHHALPPNWSQLSYEEFLAQRRSLMADVIKLAFETIGDNTGVPEPALALDETPDVYLHPERPFTNVYAVRKVIRGLEGSVLWYEQHMDPKILELLSDDLDLEGVTGLRLLSGPAHITPKAKKAFERFAAKLEHAGVQCDWRAPSAGRCAHDARASHLRRQADL